MKYDDAAYHYGAENFPKNVPLENGGVHIALFMKFCFRKGWIGQLHLDDEPEDTQKVVDGTLSATDFFFKYCDGKLTNEDFNDEGNLFAEKYYGHDGLYLDDYTSLFGDVPYLVSEDDLDFDRLEALMNQRLKRNQLTTVQDVKPWWKFW